MFEQERQLYTEQYFRKEHSESHAASAAIVPLVLELVDVNSVLDIGCGVGAFLKRFKNWGVKTIQGIDGDYVPNWILQVPPSFVAVHDLKEPLWLNCSYDLVVCLEVAEHLPESAADTLVASICRHSDTVLFSAATPGQGGVSHINEQPHEYWADKFSVHRYHQVDCLRQRLEPEKFVPPWYRNNTFIYANGKSLDDNYKLADHLRQAS